MWERRYDVVAPPRTASGQRFYSEVDIHRIALLKNLVDRGYAIGSIAALDAQQLEQLLVDHIDRESGSHLPVKNASIQIVIVGTTLAHRIQKSLSTLQQDHLLAPTVFENMTQAFANCSAGSTDLLLLHLSSLHPDDIGRVLALRSACRATSVAIVYSFASESTLEQLKQAGVRAWREPLGRSDTWRMLLDLLGARLDSVAVDKPDSRPPAPRHYPDEVLMDMANTSVTITCECPRHIADIIMQLSAFERYSNECMSLTPADAFLHSYLANMSGRARAMFEVALERLEREERWIASRT